jgi:hypothetical protein
MTSAAPAAQKIKRFNNRPFCRFGQAERVAVGGEVHRLPAEITNKTFDVAAVY